MVEPLAIVSLGIEACKALVSYCNGWRAFDTEIDSVKMKAQGLLSTLQIVDKLLGETAAVNPIIAADIALKLSENEAWIRKVCEQVTKCSAVRNSSIVDQKLRETAKKVKYPFRRDILKGTADILQTLQINLNTALLALQIQQTSVLAQQTESLQRVEVLGTALMTRIGQYGSSLDKTELAIHSNPSQSQCQIASRHPTQRRPAFYTYRNTKSTKRIRFVSGWLRLSIEMMISIENGTHGFALSPTLRFRTIVPETAPAFNLISQALVNEPSNLQSNEEFSNTIIQSLQRLFDEGRASPGDQTQDGSTLITAVCFEICLLLLGKSDINFLPHYPVLRYLVDAGCPINEPSKSRSLHLLFGYRLHRPFSVLVVELVRLGFLVTDGDLSGTDVRFFRLAFMHSEEAFMVSNVSRAILSQSESELKHSIASQEVSASDYRLFRMCLSWPSGLNILLESMSAIEPEETERLLRSAIDYDFLDSVKLLVDHGSPISNATVWVCNSQETKEIIFEAFIARRKRLVELAWTMLPRNAQRELALERDCLPDSRAREIYDHLKRHDIFMSPALLPYVDDSDLGVSVFHGPNLSMDDMELLYQAGFRDIDTPDIDGYTPISRSDMHSLGKDLIGYAFERVQWFVSKGAVLGSPPTITGSTPSHHISRNITWLFMAQLWPLLSLIPGDPRGTGPYSLLKYYPDFTRLLYESGNTDHCSCFCSSAGCTPLSMALGLILTGPWKFPPLQSVNNQQDTRLFFQEFALQEFISEVPSFGATAQDVLRFITFTDLGLTHTCCRLHDTRHGISGTPFEREEAEEIQDEERLLLKGFEELLGDIMREYHQLGMPLLEYIRTRWCCRVREYLWNNGEKVYSHSLCTRLEPESARQCDETEADEKSKDEV